MVYIKRAMDTNGNLRSCEYFIKKDESAVNADSSF